MLSDLIGLAKPRQGARSAAVGLFAILIASLLVVAIHDAVRPSKGLFSHAGGDFRAFYCAGEAVAARADPYLVEPLRSCEIRTAAGTAISNDAVDPAPLPGYALAFFGTLSHLPFSIAKAVWFVGLVTSIFAGAWFIGQLTGFPTLLVLLALSLLDGYINLIFGQLPPVVTALIAGGAYCIERRRPACAAAFAVASMIEPHVGLAACLSMFFWLPRTRLPLTVGAAALLVVSFSATGLTGNVAYLTQILPMHAASELIAVDQWSLSHQLHVFGLNDVLALRLGSLSYLAMIVVGIVFARRAATALASDSLIVALPPAAVLLGGAYIHELQLAVALPAAFILAARATRWKAPVWGALMLLVFPWFSFAASHAALTAATASLALATCFWMTTIASRDRSKPSRIGVAIGVLAGFVLLLAMFRGLRGPAIASVSQQIPARYVSANLLASQNWEAYLRSEPALSVSTPGKELEKVPSWLALILLLAVAARQRRPEAARDRARTDIPPLRDDAAPAW